jgi:DNA-directed RNA polymerase specialized sigma24 family protein
MSATRKTTHSLKRTDQLSKHLRNPQYAALNTAMEEISRKGNKDTLNFLVSVEAEIQRFGLSQRFSASTILHESYIRGITAIDSGKTIPKPFAWLRLTCRYIIKEKNRHQGRSTQFDLVESLLFDDNDSEFSDEEEDDGIQSKVKHALKQLPPLEQTIIELKVIQKRQWREVPQMLQQMKMGTYSVDALKKRKERAFKRMRQFITDAG